MKSIIGYVFAILLMLNCSCVPTGTGQPQRFPNPQQQKFDDMLARFNNSSLKYSSNQIRKKEFLDSVKYATYCFVASSKLFTNWQGVISHINSQKSGNSTVLEFDITYKPEEYREVTFNCKYIFPTDSLSSDELYQKVHELDGYETVYFDGFIRTLSDKTVKYSWSSSDDLFLPYPKFQFFVIDLSTNQKSDTISPNLKNAIDLTFDAIEPLKLNFEGKISKKECNKLVTAIAPKFEDAKSRLTISEKRYIDRLAQACTVNFLYADE